MAGYGCQERTLAKRQCLCFNEVIAGKSMAAKQYFFEDFRPGQRFPGAPHTLDETAFRLFAQMTGVRTRCTTTPSTPRPRVSVLRLPMDYC